MIQGAFSNYKISYHLFPVNHKVSVSGAWNCSQRYHLWSRYLGFVPILFHIWSPTLSPAQLYNRATIYYSLCIYENRASEWLSDLFTQDYTEDWSQILTPRLAPLPQHGSCSTCPADSSLPSISPSLHSPIRAEAQSQQKATFSDSTATPGTANQRKCQACKRSTAFEIVKNHR